MQRQLRQDTNGETDWCTQASTRPLPWQKTCHRQDGHTAMSATPAITGHRMSPSRHPPLTLLHAPPHMEKTNGCKLQQGATYALLLSFRDAIATAQP